MHVLDAVEVAGSDEDEIGGHGLRLGQCTGGALGAAADREFLLLHRDEQSLLLLHPQHADLVDVEDALVGPVHGTGLDPLVCWSGQIGTRLERIVADVAQQSPSESPGGVYERRLVVALVLDE